MKHIATNPFMNHAECSGNITETTTSSVNKKETKEAIINSVFYQKEKLNNDTCMYKRIIIVAILLNLFFIAKVFSQLVTNNNVMISNSSIITVKGDIENTTGTTIDNNGTIELTGDWVNHATNIFGTSSGTVLLNGASQNIKGSSSTIFNNLTLQGSGTKTLVQDASAGGDYISPAGVLNIGNVSLDLNSRTLTISNSSPSAVTSGTGYILSEAIDNSSKVKWNINNSVGSHIIPFGNASGDLVPVTFNLTGGTAGEVMLSTYATAADNSPLPLTPVAVTHVRDITGADNSANTVDRFWQVDVTGNPTASLTFNYAPSENAANGNTNMKMQRWNENNLGWEMPVPVQANLTSQSVMANGITTFGTWAVSREASPLPVELLLFSAKAVKNNKIECQWRTAAEINNAFFTLERSKDATHFEEVGKVNGAGTSNVIHNYSYDDLNPFAGISYYRLRQTDFNGESTWSDIHSVNISNDEIRIEVFPNPVADFVNINSSSEDLLNIKMTDTNGKLVLQEKDVKQNTRIDFTLYPAGAYYLTMYNSTGENIKTVRLVKN